MSLDELNELATYLVAVEDWLREKCEARHHEDMADGVLKAFRIIDSLCDGLRAAASIGDNRKFTGDNGA